MTRYSITAALTIALAIVNPSWATTLPTPGPAPLDSAIAYYYIQTGEITVSVNNVQYWKVLSESASLTGDPAINLPAAGGFVNDSDVVIAEFVVGPFFTYTDIELGPVAEPHLPTDDLGIYWTGGTDTRPEEYAPLVYISIPEPTTCSLAIIATLCLVVGRRRR